MLNASYNLKLRNIKAYIPEYPVGTAEECADMIHEFLPIARTVKALSELKIISFGPRPLNFLACNAPIKQLYNLGVEIEENSELDLFEAFNKHEGDERIPAVVAEMEAELAASLKKLRTDHIDLYQFHNPSPENLDKILAPGGAMEALLEAKAKGVVGHIGITAHLSQTFEKALKVDEIETIMFPYNIVEQQGKELIDRCAEKGKAFIDMKPLAGGAIEDGRLALRYVLSNPAVTVSIPGMAAPEELEQNVAGSANTAPLTPEEKAACQKVRDTLGTQFCRRCNYCAPCTVGIQIPSCFLFHGYLERYGLAGWAHERYDTLTVKAGACIGCGKCETRCPYNLPIRDMLKKVAQDFGE